MGTIDPAPAPRPVEDRDAEPARSIWTHPLFLLAAVVLFGRAAYRAGHRAATPVLPPKPTTAPVPQVVYVPFPIHASPASATTAAPSPAVPAKAAGEEAPPAIARVQTEERRGTAFDKDQKTGFSSETAAAFGAAQAEEKKKKWRDRATAARRRLGGCWSRSRQECRPDAVPPRDRGRQGRLRSPSGRVPDRRVSARLAQGLSRCSSRAGTSQRHFGERRPVILLLLGRERRLIARRGQ
jgi:hypothetical protein